MEEDALKLQAEATAQALGETAQGQHVLRESMQQLEVQLRGAWLGHARQEFEALKVRSSQPWESRDPDSQPELASRASPRDPPDPGQPPSTTASILCDPGQNPYPSPLLSFPICKQNQQLMSQSGARDSTQIRYSARGQEDARYSTSEYF